MKITLEMSQAETRVYPHAPESLQDLLNIFNMEWSTRASSIH